MTKIILSRWYKSKNWGDALNPILIKKLSGGYPVRLSRPETILMNKLTKEPAHRIASTILSKSLRQPVYLVVGSILSWADRNTIVWGPGFISSEKRLKEKPKKICAVRGPLTRKIILEDGFECPEIYGDPALLFPRFYKQKVKKRYKLGIIPHYIDQGNPVLKIFKEDSNILLINIKGGIEKVVRDILCCEKIASSSLHGIIAADAYDIPSIWIKFSYNVIGEGFKFRDYFMSVGRKDKKPLFITEKTTLESIYKMFYEYKIDIDLEQLLESCPFKKSIIFKS